MSTEANEVKVNREAARAIAAAVTAGLKQVGGTGSLLHSCVTIAVKHYARKPIPKPDIELTLSLLAESQGWKGRTVDIRKSQFRSVLLNYVKLPEAMKAFADKVGHCSWHDGIALAQLLKKNTPAQAVAKHASRGKASKAQNPATLARSDAKATIAKFVKRVLKMSKIEKDFRDALAELCKDHGIKV